MGKRVIFTEEQMNYICECNGISPDMLDEDEGGGATGTCTVGDYPVYGKAGLQVNSDDPTLIHQKPGGVSMERQK